MRLTVEVRCEKKILMKLAAYVFLSTVACAMAQSESLHSSELKFGDLGDFKLENGAVIRDCRIAYHTLGKLNDDKSNVVLWPTWFTGVQSNLSRLPVLTAMSTHRATSSSSLMPWATASLPRHLTVLSSPYGVSGLHHPGHGKFAVSPFNRESRDQSYSRCDGYFHGRNANVPVDRLVSRLYGQSCRPRRFSAPDRLGYASMAQRGECH